MQPHRTSPGLAGPRITPLEDPGTDFPFYNGAPVFLNWGQWLFVLAMVGLGFALLVLPISWPGGALGPIIPALLLPAMPLAALALVARGHSRVVFGRVGRRELRLMLGFALLNLVVSIGIGTVLRTWMVVTPNSNIGPLTEMDGPARLVFFVKTLPQLLGEEVITLLPFLALLTVLTHRRLGIGRNQAVVAAWLSTSVLFGLIHLPTYNWNLIQCLVVIGSARMVLTLPWILTKNLWVSTGAHIINDWLLFGMALAATALPQPG